MTRILAIDPGSAESGWCLIDADTRQPLAFGKDANRSLLGIIWRQRHEFERAAVEMVASYGMAVGAEVFETCVWIGRFVEAIESAHARPHELIYRREVKLHHCLDSRAKDSNIRQALVDRFAPGLPNHGKGTKDDPGWFHGFRADVWQAYALAVLVADRLDGPEAA